MDIPLGVCKCSFWRKSDRAAHVESGHSEDGCSVPWCKCHKFLQASLADLEAGAPKPTQGAALKGPSPAEEDLAARIARSSIIPPPERGYKFHPSRGWELDFSWTLADYDMETRRRFLRANLSRDVALEVEGYDHRKPQRFMSDLQKYRALSLMGWILLRYTWSEIKAGWAIHDLEALFSGNDLTELAGLKRKLP